jgi:lipopolysaccharide/colanic/teichoic acid biosynthesis glycosyltransferase
MYIKVVKPSLDFCFGLILFIITLPLLIVITIMLFFIYHDNPLYFQNRPGLNARIFRIIKFKTMNDLRDKSGNLLSDSERLTKIGKFLRNTSLDELPQLINVLKGDLSFVGPRPLLTEYLQLYNSEQMRRHSLKPGITGLAQINGRNAISWEEKFKLDVWYVDHISFRLDCKILFNTVFRVLNSSGISSETSATMEKFTGN